MRIPQLLTALLLLGMLANVPAAAQEVPIGWEMGLTPAPGSEEVNFTLGANGEVGLSFWVRNDYETNSITVTIEYDLPFSADVSGPDEVEVGAGDNETFTFTVKGVTVIDFDAGQSDEYEVEGRIANYGSLPAGSADVDNDNEGMLVIPHIVDLDLYLEDPSGATNAGTATELTAVVTNSGNAPDSVRVATVDDTCPLLEVSGEQALLGVSIAKGGTHTVNLTAIASPSHPTKTCRIELSIQSQGDWNVGTLRTADSEEITLKIESEPVGGSGSGGGGSSSGDGGSDDGDEVISSNFAPLPIWLPLAAFSGAALLRRRE
jgi:uncharacterized protein (TIGR03382 family)